jgi:hypothetical protein
MSTPATEAVDANHTATEPAIVAQLNPDLLDTITGSVAMKPPVDVQVEDNETNQSNLENASTEAGVTQDNVTEVGRTTPIPVFFCLKEVPLEFSKHSRYYSDRTGNSARQC